MKILHIISGPINSGASKGAILLNNNLVKLGIDSKILTDDKLKNNNNIISTSKTIKEKFFKITRIIIEKLPKIFFYKRKKTSFSNGLIGYNFLNNKEFIFADIIHFHWVSNGFLNLSILSKFNKPVVWTLRDMWLFTGGCHYTLGCNNFKKICKSCPQLKSNLKYDLSTYNQSRKIKFLSKKIFYVSVSKWLLKYAKKSKILRNKKVIQINNLVDKENFYYKKKNIKNSKKIILTFGSVNVSSPYKGLKYFLDSFKYLKKKTRYEVHIFGKFWDFKEINNLGIKYNYHGYISSKSYLRKIYSNTDIFVACSLQDAFPKMFMEAMLCNSAIVCFKETVYEEFVRHKIDGYCARHASSKDIANGIEWLSSNKARLNKIKKLASLRAKNKINNHKSTLKYIDLYKKILKEN